MRKWSRALLPVLFGVAGAVAAQATDYRAQYAEQWPLSLSSAQSGAYRVVLEPAIYRRAGAADLGDLQVFNAAGQALPSALLAPDQPLAQPPVQRSEPRHEPRNEPRREPERRRDDNNNNNNNRDRRANLQ